MRARPFKEISTICVRTADDARIEAEKRGRLDPSFFAPDAGASGSTRSADAAGVSAARPGAAYGSVGFSYGTSEEQQGAAAEAPPPPPPPPPPALPTAAADEPPFAPSFDVPVRA